MYICICVIDIQYKRLIKDVMDHEMANKMISVVIYEINWAD